MTEISSCDRETIVRQLGREPRVLEGIAARCSFGAPAVLVQRPYDEAGVPFPTTFWLTCRAEVAAVSRFESAGGVAEMARELAAHPALRRSRAAADRRVQRVRDGLCRSAPVRDRGAALRLGLAGEPPGAPIKCLHAHVAVACGCPPYAFGELVRARVGAPPRTGCCAWT